MPYRRTFLIVFSLCGAIAFHVCRGPDTCQQNPEGDEDAGQQIGETGQAENQGNADTSELEQAPTGKKKYLCKCF